MNVIETIEGFVLNYQFVICAALGIIAALAIIIIAVRSGQENRKNKQLLSQINDTVVEIKSTANRLENKRSEVIYIDNRTSVGEDSEEKPLQEHEDQMETETACEEEIQVGEAAEEPAPVDDNEKDEETVKGPVKYVDRNCSTNKHGEVYTLDELNALIKE